MRLFDFVQKNNAVGTAAYRFGELTALIIAHISRRRPDKAGHTVLFHVFAHINANHAALIIKECFGECLGQFRLAYARGAKEDKGTNRTVGVFDARTGTQNGFADGFDRFVLTDYAFMEHIFQMNELFPLAREHLADGNTRPAADDLGDVFFADFFFEQGFALCAGGNFFFFFLQLLLQLREFAIFEFRQTVEVIGAFRTFHLTVDLVDFLFDGPHAQNGLLFAVPFGLEGVFLRLQIRLFLRDFREFFLRSSIGFLFQRLFFNFQLHDFAADFVDRCRHGFDFRTQLGRGFIH